MSVLLCLVLSAALEQEALASIPPPPPEYSYASDAAVAHWKSLKFGLRIHWGEYAITGLGPESWPLNNNANQSFLRWYWDQYKSWRPAKYDPKEWIGMMRAAGVKYFTFTTKHHEGFSMYDTETEVHDCWNLESGAASIVPCPPKHHYSSKEAFGRDVTGELVEAARAGGVEPGLYFSHIDWYDAAMRIDQWNAVAAPGAASKGVWCKGRACDPALYNSTSDPAMWNRFVLRHRAQIAEVLTKYGNPILMSLDMNFPDSFNKPMVETIELARELAPNTLFRGRGIGGCKKDGGYGDYFTPEETFPDTPIPGTWQVIFHGSNFMSYDPDASHYVSGDFIVWHLVDTVAKGGNFEIGYGPDANGQFHPKATEALAFAGRWLDTNGEAIYNTQSMPEHWNDTASDFVRYTRSMDNETVYAIALNSTTAASTPMPSLHNLKLACVTPVPGSQITLLGFRDPADLKPYPLSWAVDAEGNTVIQLPASHPLPQGPGYAFKIRGAPRACESAKAARVADAVLV